MKWRIVLNKERTEGGKEGSLKIIIKMSNIINQGFTSTRCKLVGGTVQRTYTQGRKESLRERNIQLTMIIVLSVIINAITTISDFWN